MNDCMRSRYRWLRRFLAAFCVTLLAVLTVMGCVIADINTRRTALAEDPLTTTTVEIGAAALPAWAQKAVSLLPAEVRLLGLIPETLGLTIPREQDRQEYLPRFE